MKDTFTTNSRHKTNKFQHLNIKHATYNMSKFIFQFSKQKKYFGGVDFLAAVWDGNHPFCPHSGDVYKVRDELKRSDNFSSIGGSHVDGSEMFFDAIAIAIGFNVNVSVPSQHRTAFSKCT